jgi:hypothetical protein
MAADKKLNFDSPNLLVEHRDAIERAAKKAVRAALLKHKQANNPVAIWRAGKVVLLSPEEITIPNEDDAI